MGTPASACVCITSAATRRNLPARRCRISAVMSFGINAYAQSMAGRAAVAADFVKPFSMGRNWLFFRWFIDVNKK